MLAKKQQTETMDNITHTPLSTSPSPTFSSMEAEGKSSDESSTSIPVEESKTVTMPDGKQVKAFSGEEITQALENASQIAEEKFTPSSSNHESKITQLNIPTEKETSPAIDKEKKHYRLDEEANAWQVKTNEGEESEEWKSTDDFLTSENSIRKDVSGNKPKIPSIRRNQIYGLVMANQKELPPHVESIMKDTPEYDAYKKALSAVMVNASEKTIFALEISEKKLYYKLKIKEAIKEAERLRDFYQNQSNQAQAEGRHHEHFDHALLRTGEAMSAAQQALDIFDQIQQEPNVERKNILQKELKAALQTYDYALHQASQALASERPRLTRPSGSW